MKYSHILVIVIMLIEGAQAMNVEITYPENGSIFNTPYIDLKAMASGGEPPYKCLWFLDNGRMFPSAHKWESPEGKSSWLSIGEHEIEVLCEDSGGNRATDSINVIIEEPKLYVSIISPENGTVYGEILFKANVSGTPPYEYKWTSDRDGIIGNTEEFSKELSLGEHTITLKVIDSLALVGYDEIRIDIKDAPRVNLISPENNKTYYGLVKFDADISGGKPPYTIKWFSTIDGDMGNAENFNKTLTPGEHRIIIQVSDTEGAVVERSVSIRVEPGLTASILSPEEGTYFGEIDFRAKISEGTPPYTITWVSSRDGFLSDKENFTRTLSDGEHIIVLKVVDSHGQSVMDRKRIKKSSLSDYLSYVILSIIVIAFVILVIKFRGRGREW